mmetsp:Transcript_65453/g.156348  ORF Transcript_65453/g.156348 Transcript_65453/m.156348 type:complete len:275 (+) Transcript_65453:130-954(+)
MLLQVVRQVIHRIIWQHLADLDEAFREIGHHVLHKVLTQGQIPKLLLCSLMVRDDAEAGCMPLLLPLLCTAVILLLHGLCSLGSCFGFLCPTLTNLARDLFFGSQVIVRPPISLDVYPSTFEDVLLVLAVNGKVEHAFACDILEEVLQAVHILREVVVDIGLHGLLESLERSTAALPSSLAGSGRRLCDDHHGRARLLVEPALNLRRRWLSALWLSLLLLLRLRHLYVVPEQLLRLCETDAPCIEDVPPEVAHAGGDLRYRFVQIRAAQLFGQG